MHFEQIPLEEVDWTELDKFADRTPEQREPWLRYLVSIGAGVPVVAVLRDGGSNVGWFTGLRKSILGIPILGSPFKGTNTAYMGLNLLPQISRIDAMRSLAQFSTSDLKCAYLEVVDVCSTPGEARKAGFAVETTPGFISDLSLSEDELLARMSSACRRCIRKAEKSGVVIEEADPYGFASEYHEQLTNVFRHQGLEPTYSEQRVARLIESVHPSGDLLLLRARTADGRSIATAIYCGFGRYSGFWGNGSVREMLHLRPNQAIHWYAMRYWKGRGVRWHHWGGGGQYKRAYGPDPLVYCHQFRAVMPGLVKLRRPAIRAYYVLRKWRMKLAN